MNENAPKFSSSSLFLFSVFCFEFLVFSCVVEFVACISHSFCVSIIFI